MDKIEEIIKLKSLLDQGAITEEEFSILKKRLLSKETNSSESQVTTQPSSQKDVNITKVKFEKTSSKINQPDKIKVREDGSSTKLEFSKKEALRMLDKIDVGFAQQNLIYYSEIGDYKTVELLLIAGLSPNEFWFNPDQEKNIYPLHNVAGFGTSRMVKLLLIYGADINLEDDYGFTALFYAIDIDNIETIKLLIEQGADLNHKNNEQISPVYYAKKHKKPEMVKVLLDAGAEEMKSKEKVKVQNSNFSTFLIDFLPSLFSSRLFRLGLFVIIIGALVSILSLFNVDIEDEQAVIKDMEGTWIGYDHGNGIYTHYKLVISGKTFKGWMKTTYTNKEPSWSSQPDERGTFTLSPVQGYTNSSGNYRNINFSKVGGGYGNNSLTARALTNMIIYDDGSGLYVVGWASMSKK